MAPRLVEELASMTEGEALQLQREGAARVETEDRLPHQIARVAGVDVAYDEHSDRLFSAAVVLDAKTLEVLETAGVEAKARFPYVPGLFSFRELPPVAAALEKLGKPPDLVVCDGHGVRRIGWSTRCAAADYLFSGRRGRLRGVPLPRLLNHAAQTPCQFVPPPGCPRAVAGSGDRNRARRRGARVQ